MANTSYVVPCRPYSALGATVYVVANYTLGPGSQWQTTVSQHVDPNCAGTMTTQTVTTGMYALGDVPLANITGAATAGNATAVAALNVTVTSITIEAASSFVLSVINTNCPGVGANATNVPLDIFTAGCATFGIPSSATCPVQYDIVQTAYNDTVMYLGHRADASLPACTPASHPTAIDALRAACDGPCPVTPVSPTVPPPVFAGSAMGAAIGGTLACLVLLISALIAWNWFSARRLQRALASVADEPWRALVATERNTRILAFRDISYRIRTAQGSASERVVLGGRHAVSGVVAPGTLLAILGGSGAGKTTLLDILTGRSKRGVVGGDVILGQHTLTKRRFKHLAGYVDQEDTLLPHLTARETVQYAARLRLPADISAVAVAARVRALLAALRITHVADQQIGGRGVRGISGGERRRVAIACELVTLPAVLFLDEPTSGLDAHSAVVVMSSVRTLADAAGTIVVCSIHQPRSNLFALFDSVLLLAHGNPVYNGPVASALAYFASIGRPCPPNYNPADHMVDVAAATRREIDGAAPQTKSTSQIHDDATADASDLELQARTTAAPDHNAADDEDGQADGAVDLAAVFAASTLAADLAAQVKAAFAEALPHEAASTSSHVQRGGRCCHGLHTFAILCGRTALTLQRDPLLLIANYVLAVALSLFLGGLFWQVEDTLSGIQNRLGYIFFALAIFMFLAISSLELFASERMQFVVERANGYYGVSAYFLTKVLLDLLVLKGIPAILFASISYYMVGLTDDPATFGLFLLGLVLFNLTAAAFNTMMGALVQDRGVATMLIALVNLFNLLLSGFLLNRNAIPPVLAWIPYLSYFSYAFEALAVNEASNITISDTVGQVGFTINSDAILAIFGYDVANYWRDIGCLAAFFVGFLAIAFVATKLFVRERR